MRWRWYLKQVICIARDASPSRAFMRLEPVLRAAGYAVKLIVGDGSPLSAGEPMTSAYVAAAKILLLGMSSPAENAEPEIQAAELARGLNIPYGFYGDVPKCWLARAVPGAYFYDLAQTASFYFALDEADAEAAREFFPEAKIFATGSPLREEMFFPVMGYREVRNKLGVKDDEKLILAPGGKLRGGGNILFWGTIMEALSLVSEGGRMRFKLIMAPHPGDRNLHLVDPADSGKPIDMYQQLAELSPVSAELVLKSKMPTADIIAGADLVIEFSSSIGNGAAYQRKPMITLAPQVPLNQIRDKSGKYYLEVVELGLSEFVTGNTFSLAATIAKLLTEGGYAPQRARQEEVCPAPREKGLALRKMAEAIGELTK
jgi:hypothetical protein